MKSLLIATLCATPILPAVTSTSIATDPVPTPVPVASADALGFPVPTDGFIIQSPEGDPLGLDQLLRAYGEVTGQTVLYTNETKTFLGATAINMASDELAVPADRVQNTVEVLLSLHGFLMVPLTDTEPRLVQIVSLQTGERNVVRRKAIDADPDQLGLVAEHPAVIFRMAVHLPNTDVRQLSNSMRTLITDTNVQQMMPAGSSNSLVLIGTGQFLADTVSMFLAIDAAAGQSHAAPSESSDE